MKSFDRKVISKKDALTFLKKNNFKEETDFINEDDEKHYLVKNIGYLVIYDFIDEAELFKSKKYYNEFMNDDDDISIVEDVDLEYVLEYRDSLIMHLSKSINFPLELTDNIESLKKLDLMIAKKGNKEFDFVKNFEPFFAYFANAIFNEVDTDSRIMTINDEGISLRVVKSGEEFFEIFTPFRKMIINQDETFSFYALAKQIVYPFELDIKKKGTN